MAATRKARPGQGKHQRRDGKAYAAYVKKRDVTPDPKPMSRHRDQERLDAMRPPYAQCPLCNSRFDRYPGCTRHHVIKKSQGGDDWRANIVWLCGDGTRGCHGLIEAGDRSTRRRLRLYLERERPETIRYVVRKISTRNRAPLSAGVEWLDRHYPRELHGPPIASTRRSG